ncbi:hypothetical protein MMC19_003910 [Ptychographa xylographoides]|nr:hypothetical protein [Ptychographa xylographoides]
MLTAEMRKQFEAWMQAVVTNDTEAMEMVGLVVSVAERQRAATAARMSQAGALALGVAASIERSKRSIEAAVGNTKQPEGELKRVSF